MQLLKILKSLHGLHGLVQPLPCRLNSVNQQILRECMHETLHLESPQKQLSQANLLFMSLERLEVSLIELFPAFLEKGEYFLKF